MQPSEKLSVESQALITLACAVAYFYAYQLNAHYFEWFEFSQGVNWLYLPSGLRLLFVLVLAHRGALGITLGSVAINYMFGAPDAHVFNLGTALISGGSPYLARFIAIRFFQLDTGLSGLNGKAFFKITVLFALTNALLHQIWFFGIDKTDNVITSALVMAVGDWFGTVLVLACASLLIRTVKSFRHIKP
jgi:hypothetical protein